MCIETRCDDRSRLLFDDQSRAAHFLARQQFFALVVIRLEHSLFRWIEHGTHRTRDGITIDRGRGPAELSGVRRAQGERPAQNLDIEVRNRSSVQVLIRLIESVAENGRMPLGQMSNRHGYGTMIELTTRTGTQRRWILGGGSYQSVDAPIAYFGLGSVPKSELGELGLRVTWPNGKVTKITDVPVNRRIRISQSGKKPYYRKLSGQGR